MNTKSKLNKFFTGTAWISGIALLVVAILTMVLFYTKASRENDLQRQEAQKKVDAIADTKSEQPEETPEPEQPEDQPEAVQTTADVTDRSVEDVMIQRGMLTEEDKAAQAEYGEDAFAANKTAEERGTSAKEDASLGAIESYQREQWKAMIPSEVRWKSYSIDLKDGSETRVTSSAKDLGYVKYDITSALELAFPCEKDDEQGIGEELLARLGNPFVAGTWIRGTANIEYDGVKARDIEGNEHFNEWILEDRKAYAKDREEFEKIMKEDAVIDGGYTLEYDYDEIPGPGGDGLNHWVTCLGEDENGYMIFVLNDRYRDLVGDWYAWFRGTHAFYGAKDWHTRAKSVLDNRNSRRARPEFTDEADRQDSLTSFVYAGIDKNGNRTSEFWGINRCTSDWCIFGGTKTGEGKIIIQGGGTSSQSSVTSTTITNVTSKKEEKKEEEKKKDNPKTKSNKHKEASSVNKQQNIIDGKNPVGQGTDNFQAQKPATPAATVQEAQHQPTDQTQAIIDNGGQKTTPGQEGPTIGSGSGGEVRETPGGVTVEDSPRPTEESPNNEWTENETAETPPIEQKPDPDGDGGSKDNTGMPGGFGF